MNENENIVAEEVTENVDTTTTEESVDEKSKPAEKTFTQEEVNEIIRKRHERDERRIRQEFERKYSNAEYLQNVVKAGLDTDDVEKATDALAGFYASKGKEIPTRPQAQILNTRDLERLAKADAEDIIDSGYDDVVDEVNRLATIGATNMTAREKAMFKILAEHRANVEKKLELIELGVTDEDYNSPEFQQFAGKFTDKTPISEVWKYYTQTRPKKEHKTMGSMKNTPTDKTKDFYTAEEIARLTEEDLADPHVWEAVRRSMTGA